MLLTLLILTAALAGLLPLRPDPEGHWWLGRDYTILLKGVCAVVVIMVHIPEAYSNPLQDAVGSFAYIAVSLFFFFSAYGMTLSLGREGYMKHFWRNRLVALLIPCLTANTVSMLTQTQLQHTPFEAAMLYRINLYVVQLLGYCLMFYLTHTLCRRYGVRPASANIILMIGIVVASVAMYIARIGWQVECWGLVVGTLMAGFARVRHAVNRRSVRRIGTCLLLSAALGVLYLKFKTMPVTGDYLLRALLCCALIGTLLCATARLRCGNRWGMLLGQISFEVYLIHDTVLHACADLMPTLMSGTYQILAVGITLAGAYLLHRLDAAIVTRLRA